MFRVRLGVSRVLGAFVLLSVAGAVFAPSLRAYEEASASCGERSEDMTVEELGDRDLGRTRAALRREQDYRLLARFLRDQGYQGRPGHAFGWRVQDGSWAVVVPFEGPEDSGAGVVLSEKMDGTRALEAGIFGDPVEGIFSSVSDFKVVDGEVVAAESWWSCYWRCLLVSCGSGAVACRYSGPYWWSCTVAVCGSTAFLCAIVCS